MNKNLPTYFSYWGKADKHDEGKPAWHPLVYHSLDVAAVADRLLNRHHRLCERLIHLSGLSQSCLLSWLHFFAALHDIGKFSSAFQQLRPELAPERPKRYFYKIRHDTLGHLFWGARLQAWLQQKNCFKRIDSGESDYLDEVLDQWMLAVTGHHGQPPKTAKQPLVVSFAPQDEQAAMEFTDVVATLFLPTEPLVLPMPAKDLRRKTQLFSWWLAGVSVLADWLGSNRTFFEFNTNAMPLDRYWCEVALPAADIALDSTGLLPNAAADIQDIGQLFEGIRIPTPLQAACSEIPLDTGPNLLLVEDATGSGKTEAAFILLNRLMAEGNADGAYLALPTMATANAMYRRTSKVYHYLFQEQGQPSSLVLAHGSRNLDDGFRDSVLPQALNSGHYEPGEYDAGARCNAWLVDGSKRALLAQMGVGTIDQALLAVLTSRHQSLRLLGLLNKVLIVDEVHASDAYMHRLLCELLSLHAKGGGSAILLSATLPKKMRDELIEAFSEGAGREPPVLREDGYPLLTRVGAADQSQMVVATRRSLARTLGFELLLDEESVLAWVIERAEAGACVAWIRNTVTDAVEAFRRLSERLDTGRLTLFHARFAMGDRLVIEDKVLNAFGQKSGALERRGQVVVATQVIEQSLDIDFDEMVSDLAPIDLLVQRAGRLRRHCRDGGGDPVEGGDQRGSTTLRVLSPDPDEAADGEWYARLFRRAAPVYPDHGQLWLTARLLKDRQRIAVPEELRMFIEGVFGEKSMVEVPDALLERSSRAAGQRSADASLASFNAIKPSAGYRHVGGEWWDESYTPTRLGEITATVRLVCWDGEQLHPWSKDTHHPWAMSEVRIQRALLKEAVAPESSGLGEAVDTLRAGWPKGTDDILLLPLVDQSGRWTGFGKDENGSAVTVVYTDKLGLEIG